MRDFLIIPKMRVGILIGKDGKTKKEIEKSLSCKLTISVDGDIKISSRDSLNLLKCKNIIKAIGRGFGSEDAFDLLDDDYILEIINLPDEIGKSKKVIKRYKARVIGKDGFVKNHMGELTNTKIAVFGKTISVIGKGNEVRFAVEAIHMILDGRKHSTVFRYLERVISSA